MRYDTPIYFQRITSTYNADTGNYDDVIAEEKRWASVTDTGTDTLKLVYGELKQGSSTIRLQRPYPLSFDNIRIGDKTFKADFSRHNKAFVVSEVQSNGKA